MLKKIDIKDLNLNPMTMISDEWWLVTAGNQENGYNTMTASWGHIGAIWGHNAGKPSAIIYIRPQRFTKEFVDREDMFTLSVFEKKYKRQLGYLGSHSGRDEDKIKTAGLTPVFDHNTTYFAESKMVFVCKKLYHAPVLESGFVDQSIIEDFYPEKDFHEMYIGEIVEVLSEQDS